MIIELRGAAKAAVSTALSALIGYPDNRSKDLVALLDLRTGIAVAFFLASTVFGYADITSFHNVL